ncbi:MAG: hypothetical protein AAGA68_25810 [Pseudomonadota bacterium]
MRALIASTALLCAAQSAWATLVEYEVTNLGGDNYRYDYTITNDSLGTSIELFDIAFDTALYDESSLLVASSLDVNAEWDQLVFASAPGSPALYDAFTLSGGIPAGGTATGFAVEFLWLGGPGGPGAQSFQVFDAVTFSLLDSGFTVLSGGTQVDAPSTLWLAAIGGLAVAGSRRRRAA